MNETVRPTPASWLILMGIAVPLLLLAACGQDGDSARATNVPIVAVSVLPIAGVVDRLLPPGASEVQVLVPAGASPHAFEPGMEQLALVQRAQLVLELGHPAFAWESSWLDGLLAGSRAVRIPLSAGCAWLEDDPHVWLDPDCLQILSARTAEALVELFPERSTEIGTRLGALQLEITAEDEAIRESLTERRGMTFLAQHAAWGYFARAYGLEQIAILSHGAGDSGAARLARVIDQARAAGIRTVFVQPQVSTEAARMVAHEIGAGIRALDPLLRDPLDALRETTVAVLEATAR
jgi:zinc transport system substrate-binding protein